MTDEEFAKSFSTMPEFFLALLPHLPMYPVCIGSLTLAELRSAVAQLKYFKEDEQRRAEHKEQSK